MPVYKYRAINAQQAVIKGLVEGSSAMEKVDQYHTKLRTKVYRVYENCSWGNNIDPGNRIEGDGGNKMCKPCERREPQDAH